MTLKFSLKQFLYEDKTEETTKSRSLRQQFLEMVQGGGLFAKEAVKELGLINFNKYEGSRFVFDLKDGTILKTEEYQANLEEIKTLKCIEEAGIENISPKLYEYDEHGDWLIMEKVKPLYIPLFRDVFNDQFGPETAKENLIYKVPAQILFNILLTKTKEWIVHTFRIAEIDNAEELYNILIANPVIQKLKQVKEVCPLANFYNLNAGNWGINSTGHLVVLDWG